MLLKSNNKLTVYDHPTSFADLSVNDKRIEISAGGEVEAGKRHLAKSVAHRNALDTCAIERQNVNIGIRGVIGDGDTDGRLACERIGGVLRNATPTLVERVSRNVGSSVHLSRTLRGNGFFKVVQLCLQLLDGLNENGDQLGIVDVLISLCVFDDKSRETLLNGVHVKGVV